MARILASEAYQQEKVNQAQGEANATIARAEAQAEAIKMVADALSKKVSYSLDKYNNCQNHVETALSFRVIQGRKVSFFYAERKCY